MSLCSCLLCKTHPDTSGPEGYLPDQLLPTHYWIQSLGSHCDYTISGINDKVTADSKLLGRDNDVMDEGLGVVAGSGFAHFEANWGSTFPSGWIWAEGIADNQTQFTLTGGNFTIAGVTSHQWIVSVRTPAGDFDFRTIDLDSFGQPHIDCENSIFAINASGLHHYTINNTSRLGAVTLRLQLEAPFDSFSAPLNVYVDLRCTTCCSFFFSSVGLTTDVDSYLRSSTSTLVW